MQKFNNPFAVNENKEIIYIKNGDTQNKDKYKNCYCSKCSKKLIPIMWKKQMLFFKLK